MYSFPVDAWRVNIYGGEQKVKKSINIELTIGNFRELSPIRHLNGRRVEYLSGNNPGVLNGYWFSYSHVKHPNIDASSEFCDILKHLKLFHIYCENLKFCSLYTFRN